MTIHILPGINQDPWKYQVSDSTKKQFGILKKLMGREDVTSLVEATDAGREGELIFRLVYAQTGCKKSFERLWISSMEDEAIRDGFDNLRDGSEYDALYEAHTQVESNDKEAIIERCKNIIKLAEQKVIDKERWAA